MIITLDHFSVCRPDRPDESESGRVTRWMRRRRGRRKEVTPHHDHDHDDDVVVVVGKDEKEMGKEEDRFILKDITGTFRPGRLCTILGPAGCGKSTLLTALGGYNAVLATKGTITIDGTTFKSRVAREIFGFVFQDDVFTETLTVYEAVCFAAACRLKHDEVEISTMETLKKLGIYSIRESRIGSILNRGISGGERKLTSIAMQLVTRPAAMILDEPTSGLDSLTALKVIAILKRLKITVIISLHQPSSEIFSLFDDLLLLARGSVVYWDESRRVIDYFTRYSVICPAYCNPADFLITILHDFRREHRDGDDPEDLALDEAMMSKSDKPLDFFIQLRKTQAQQDIVVKDTPASPSTAVPVRSNFHKMSLFSQLMLLTERELKNKMRNPVLIRARLVTSSVLSLVLGLVYLNLGMDERSIQNRLGLIFFFCNNSIFISSIIPTVTAFIEDKAVFMREHGALLYDLVPYFLSKVIAEIPMVVIGSTLAVLIIYWMVGFQNDPGAVVHFLFSSILMSYGAAAFSSMVSTACSTLPIALSIVPVTLMPLVIFSGYFVNTSTIPVYFDWIKYLSSVKYAFDIMVITEFSGLEFAADDDEGDPISGEDIIDQYVGSDSYERVYRISYLALILLICFYYLLSFIFLHRQTKLLLASI